jgi:hypothetical protein
MAIIIKLTLAIVKLGRHNSFIELNNLWRII